MKIQQPAIAVITQQHNNTIEEATSAFRPHEVTEHHEINIPDLYAQRLERMVKTSPAPSLATNTPQIYKQQSQTAVIEKAVKTWKNLCHYSALTAGALALPTLGLGVISPVLLAVPGGLFAISIICLLLRGRETPEIQKAAVELAQQNRRFDSRAA